MSGNGNPGINKLANALTGRMKKENESPLVLDFGEIRSDYSLVTNTFPVPIPRSDYVICQSAVAGKDVEEVELPYVKAGSRVLVAWVQNEAVVIDAIISANSM